MNDCKLNYLFSEKGRNFDGTKINPDTIKNNTIVLWRNKMYRVSNGGHNLIELSTLDFKVVRCVLPYSVRIGKYIKEWSKDEIFVAHVIGLVLAIDELIPKDHILRHQSDYLFLTKYYNQK